MMEAIGALRVLDQYLDDPKTLTKLYAKIHSKSKHSIFDSSSDTDEPPETETEKRMREWEEKYKVPDEIPYSPDDRGLF